MRFLNTDAVIIVDPQNDFADPSGALYVSGGETVMLDIAQLADEAHISGTTIVLTQDWHPQRHKSFATTWGFNPFTEIDMDYGKQTMWPDHCVQGSWGAALHPDMSSVENIASLIIRKGMNREIDSFSAFRENDRTTHTGLAGFLRERGITRVIVVGLAYDFCVGWSALDAKEMGFEVVVLERLTKSIALETAKDMTRQLLDAGIEVGFEGLRS